MTQTPIEPEPSPDQPDEAMDAATLASKRRSQFAIWITSICFYSFILFLMGSDLYKNVTLNHRIQTQGQRGSAAVVSSEEHIVQRGSARDKRGYRAWIQGEHGLLEVRGPKPLEPGSQVEYVHLSPGMHTRLIDSAKPEQSFVTRYLTSWYGIGQMAGITLLVFMIALTLRRIFMAATGRQPVVVRK
jgi:hypothetical protein